MREILFRGKRVDNENWIEGLLVKQIDLCGSDEICIQTWQRDSNGVRSRVSSVVPSTVGQYTGLTDKNGVKIFEGDIVKTDKFSKPNEQYIIKYDLHFGAFIGRDKYNAYFVTFDGDSDQFEVIGNIYDNPELLEGGERE